MEIRVSVTTESTVKTSSNTFYAIFTLYWQSPSPSTLIFWVNVATPGNPDVPLVPQTQFRPSSAQHSVDDTDPSTGIRFKGTITASWHSATSGKLTGDDMLFVLADGTPFNLTGDIGLWS
jgi:hypothetical protein